MRVAPVGTIAESEDAVPSASAHPNSTSVAEKKQILRPTTGVKALALSEKNSPPARDATAAQLPVFP